MALTNYERVGKGLELLRAGLAPFVERELKNLYRDRALNEALRFVSDDRNLLGQPLAQWDVAALLKLMWNSWNDVFRQPLGNAERSLVNELRDFRNRWAHQQTFSMDDAYRALDSTGRLLAAVSASQADEVEKIKLELLPVRFDEQVRSERRRSAGTAIDNQVTGNLKPWREVVNPHRDVASGRYQQAEFAADLWQVHLGEGADEYRQPVEFFRHTFLTESLKQLLIGAVCRLTGTGGDPVVQLQTNFGGGKTHSMLALYHLFSDTAARELLGIEEILRQAFPGSTGVSPAPKAARMAALPGAKRVVLVGNKTRPGTQSSSLTARWCARYGASWPGNWEVKRRLHGSAPMTRRAPAPVMCYANFLTSMDRR